MLQPLEGNMIFYYSISKLFLNIHLEHHNLKPQKYCTSLLKNDSHLQGVFTDLLQITVSSRQEFRNLLSESFWLRKLMIF